MKYQSSTILQYKKIRDVFFHSIKIEPRDFTGEKIPQYFD